LVHAEDISRAFLAVLEADRGVVHDQAFNIGRDEDVVQIRQIADGVAARFDVPVTYAEGASPDARDYRVDFGKVTRELPAFKPTWTVPAGIDELAADMERYGLVAADFEGPRFVRLARVQQLIDAGRLDTALVTRT
jgi:nucleoside-diphosphate-sugar epimerase